MLRKILKESNEDNISVGRFTSLLGDRAFALTILIFSLPNSLPIPGIPGLSTITGVPIILIALQIIAGRHTIWLPKKVADKEFSQAMLAKVITKALPVVVWIERFLKPRFLIMTQGVIERLMGVLILSMALILSLPIIGGNFLPGFCISLMALSILERDGLLAAFAMALTVGSIVFMYNIVLLAFHWIAEGATDAWGWIESRF